MFKQKINTKQLADVCDISESAMRNKLKGRKDFKMSEAKQVMGLFHADLNIFRTGRRAGGREEVTKWTKERKPHKKNVMLRWHGYGLSAN